MQHVFSSSWSDIYALHKQGVLEDGGATSRNCRLDCPSYACEHLCKFASDSRQPSYSEDFRISQPNARHVAEPSSDPSFLPHTCALAPLLKPNKTDGQPHLRAVGLCTLDAYARPSDGRRQPQVASHSWLRFYLHSSRIRFIYLSALAQQKQALAWA